MTILAQTLKGFRDYLPAIEKPRQDMLARIKRTFESFGYGPLTTPAIEYTEVLLGKYGEEGDQLLYRFLDNGDRDVALRYDLTVPLARVVATHTQLVYPWRRYQIAPVWRAEKPARGRFREFVQCDVDLVGEESLFADAEIMTLGLSVLKDLGLPKFEMRVNDRRILDGVMDLEGVPEAQRILVLRALDKLQKIGKDAVVAEMSREAGLEADAALRILELLAGEQEEKPEERLYALKESLQESERALAGIASLEAIFQQLRAGGFQDELRLDLSIARGLDYYTSTIYETFLSDHQEFGSIMSGGRYDQLLSLFSKRDIPAVGISIGVDRLLSALLELQLMKENEAPGDAYFCLFDQEDLQEVVKLSQKLRSLGLRIENNLSGKRLGRQFKEAEQKGYRFALLQGSDERTRHELKVKNLKTGEQQCFSTETEASLGAIRNYLLKQP